MRVPGRYRDRGVVAAARAGRTRRGSRAIMTITRLTVAAALGALLLVGAPLAASAEDSECRPPGGLLGLTIDDCGISASLLGIDVNLGGHQSDSGGEGTVEPEPEPAEPPGAADPPTADDSADDGSGTGEAGADGSEAGGSGGSRDGGAVSGPSTGDQLAPSSTDVQVGGVSAAPVPVVRAPAAGTGTADSTGQTLAGEHGEPISNRAAAGSPGGNGSAGDQAGQLRGPLAAIPQGSQDVGRPAVVPVVLALTAAIAGAFFMLHRRASRTRRQ